MNHLLSLSHYQPLRQPIHVMLTLLFAIFLLPIHAYAQDTLAPVTFAPLTFKQWTLNFKQKALDAGIRQETLAQVLPALTFLPNIPQLDRAQPEFVTPFLAYQSSHVTAQRVRLGQAILAEHANLLNALEAKYGVPKTLLVAFWGMETSYGSYKGNIDTFSTLATLAFEGRRADFFEQQLLDALRAAEAGHVPMQGLQGSWAGAFGHMQFMPSTLMAFAVDGDGDKQIDLMQSMPDAFASAANYLSKVGWQKGLPIAVEVQLPENFMWQTAQFNVKKPLAAWQALGLMGLDAQRVNVNDASSIAVEKKSVSKSVKSPAKKLKRKTKNKKRSKTLKKLPITKTVVNQPVFKGAPYPLSALYQAKGALTADTQAAILLPQGWRGPAFMVFDNFNVVLDWNRSVFYALSIAQLSAQLALSDANHPAVIGGSNAELGALSYAKMQQLQRLLNAQGFEAGEPDGFPGLQTQAAVRAYQLTQHLPADGLASPSLLNTMLKAP